MVIVALVLEYCLILELSVLDKDISVTYSYVLHCKFITVHNISKSLFPVSCPFNTLIFFEYFNISTFETLKFHIRSTIHFFLVFFPPLTQP